MSEGAGVEATAGATAHPVSAGAVGDRGVGGGSGCGGRIDPRLTVLGDSAFSTGPMLALLEVLGCVPMVKPWHVVSKIPGGFTVYDFVFDPEENSVTCPNGVTRVVRPSNTAAFGAVCADCPLRAQCTNAKSGRSVSLGDHHLLRREHRKWFAENDVQDEYRQYRPMVERSIAWLTRGNRRVPYRGVQKNDAWLHLRAAGLNLRRLAVMGLEYTSSQGWALA